MKKILGFLLLALVFVPVQTLCAKVVRTTVTYNENLGLKLDRYELEGDTTLARPAILFAFGGGFSGGRRDNAEYMKYFDFMAEQGFVVCSADYRTSLAGFKPTGANMLEEFAGALAGAVTDATTDFITATGYLLANAESWRIDPAKIIASGSSAGAITALQAEQAIVLGASGLPVGFNYVSVVSFAGALVSIGEPQGLPKFCPTMLFQGDADSNVPYKALTMGQMGMYGSYYIASQLKAAGVEGSFYTVLGADHSMATTPMTENLYDILGFLHHVLGGGSNEFVWTTVTLPGVADYKTDFSISDYIMSNMPH